MDQGDCLHKLGRFNKAVESYKERIRRAEQFGADRDVAIGKLTLGNVHKNVRHYPEALKAYEGARERFRQLREAGMVAVVWHQTGMVYHEAGQPEAAEDAYRKSLEIEVQLNNFAGQADTLGQLGKLYDDLLGRQEEAVAFHRQAADKYADLMDAAKEGFVRGNLAITLGKLRRLDEARQEIHRAIECGVQFGHASRSWSSWSILAKIETDAGNFTAAAEAKGKAIADYLAYRRDGGENHNASSQVICISQHFI